MVRARLIRLLGAVLAFAVGCGLAAGSFVALGMWRFAVPPLLAVPALVAGPSASQSTP